MRHFGIIGYPLKQSFSANHFNKKFADDHIDAEYSLYPLSDISEFPALLQKITFSGMNVTMPYKESIIPLLAGLDEGAKAVGAVNVIAFRGGKPYGYNSDVIGFRESIQPLLLPADHKALILGTGGAAKAVACGLRQLGLQTQFVSRSAERGLTYDSLTPDIVHAHTVIVNCTPLGMFGMQQTEPDKAPFPYHLLTAAHFLFDCIYNPAETPFLKEGKNHGCRTMNGIGMLQGQARAAWHIWNA